ncbi:ankyrin [Neocallimastix lanati (nom. inval.)]|jgi:ankyrin repeat protein|nr:ankyrin [Neocallimastix sp. JGI-2020a]
MSKEIQEYHEDSEEQLKLNKKLIILLLQNKSEEEIVNFIKKSGVNINYFTNEFNPLFQVIEFNKKSNEKIIYKLLKILINYDADLNIVWRNGKIPLFEILKLEINLKILKLAYNHGTNMFQIDNEGRNLLMYALECRTDIKVIKFLFSLNYKMSQQDKNGNTIYMYATIYYNANTYNRVLPYLLKNFRYNTNIIITLILMGKHRRAVKTNEILEIIKSNNQLINVKNNDGDTALFIAIRTHRQRKILSFLIQLGSRLDEADKIGSSPLMIAAETKNYKAFRFLLDFHPDLNFKNRNNDTPLILAAKSNDTNMVKLLLRFREVDAADTVIGKKKKFNFFNFTERYLVNSGESSSSLDALIDKDNDSYSIDESELDNLKTLKVNEQNNDGDSAFSIAVKNNNHEMIYNLAINGADTNVINNKKETPLFIALQSNNEKTISLLLSLQDDINHLDINHETPLIITLKAHNYSIAKKLLMKDADITIRDNDFKTPLMIAACDKNGGEIIEQILNNQMNNNTLHFKDKDGKTALLLAIKHNCINNVKILLKEYYRNEVTTELDNKMNNALIIACKTGNLEIVNYILDSNNGFEIDVNSRNIHLNTALMKASKKGYVNIVSSLINYGAKVDLANEKGNTALIIACYNNQINVIKKLTEYQADIEWHNKEGITPLIASLQKNSYECVKFFIDNFKPKLNYHESPMKEKMEDCFIDCVEKGYYDLIKILLDEGIIIDISNKNNTFYRLLAALIVATNNARCKVIAEIFSHKQFMEVLVEFRKTQVLIQSCRRMKKKMVELLLSLNVDVNIIDEHGNTALIEASKCAYLTSCVKEIIKRHANLNVINDEGTSALLNSCKVRDDKSFKYLVDHKANIYISDHDGNNALMYACLYGELDKIKYLVKKRVNIDAVNNNGNTALMLAVRFARLNIVKYLIKHKANVNILNKKGQNALIVGILKAYLEDKIVDFTYVSIIKFLIEKKSDINVPIDSIGNTILMFFIMNNDYDMIKYIFEYSKNVNINQKNHLGHNAFTYALKCNDSQIIDYLIQKGVDIHVEDDYGNDMIMYTACSLKPDYFKKFIKMVDKTNINKCNHARETYLIMATKMNNEKVINVLLEREADPNLQDAEGNTALHYAAFKGNKAIIEALVKYKANMEIQNSNHETPIMVACRYQKNDAVKLLLTLGASTLFVDNYIYDEMKTLDFREDQDHHVELMIENYGKISNIVSDDYLSTKTLIGRMKMYYNTAKFKDRFQGIEEYIVDGMEEFAEFIFDAVVGN